MDLDKIKKIIRDFVSFDIQNNYYQKEMKEDLVRMFKKILFEDDTTIRKFLQEFFKNTKELADEFSLISSDEEALTDEDLEDEPEEEKTDETETEEETPDEEEQSSAEEETPEEEVPAEDEPVVAPESIQHDLSKKLFERYTEIASDYLL